MKLTNYHRKAFVNAAMNDVPQIDYFEQWRKLVMPAYLLTMPKEVQTLWNNPDTREFLNKGYMRGPGSYIEVPCIDDYDDLQEPPSVREASDKLSESHEAQADETRKLRTMLGGVAKSATTRKALAAALPEFEKYLPEEAAPMSRSVPVLANVVAEFAKAGWPKEKKAK